MTEPKGVAGGTIEVVVAPAQAGERADRTLVVLLQAAGRPTPRAEIQRWMAAGRVTVDGRTLDKKSRLEAGTRVLVDPLPPPLSRAEPDASVVVNVVYEDAHLLVVDKPAGLVVHPARGHATGTLVNGLLARGGFATDTADPRDPQGHLRPGIVHRLDKDTSGLLVVAKTSGCREGLKALFAAHDIDRRYVALVAGRATNASYRTQHGRHPRDRLKFSSKVTEGKLAVTHVEVSEQLVGAAVVRCRLETGRTHQIRVHLSEQAKTPILGDSLYGSTPPSAELRRIAAGLGRQALHAELLGFAHPVTGEKLSLTSPLPPDMAAALAALRQLA